MSRNVIVLGGGLDQLPLILELNNRAYKVILIDYFQNPPAKSYCFKHYVHSSYDYDFVLKIVEMEKAIFLTSIANDPVLPIIARISEEKNLPAFYTYVTSLWATDKKLMKSLFVSCNIPTAEQFVFSELNDIHISKPLVVKPKSGTSSKDVYKFTDKQQLLTYINYS